MKSVYAFKLFFAVVFGVLLGQAVTRTEAKWHVLGREAFLAYQAHRFDRDMVHPASGSLQMILTTLAVILVVALYEAASFAGAKCVSLIAATIRER